jgi:hypothetical protein
MGDKDARCQGQTGCSDWKLHGSGLDHQGLVHKPRENVQIELIHINTMNAAEAQ